MAEVDPPAARFLAGDGAGELLTTAVRHAGAQLESWSRRSVHDRPGRAVSHVFEATLRQGDERREVLLVAHADRRELPAGAFTLEREGAPVAVWRFPNDPYLPGLPSVIDPRRVRELLDVLGVASGEVTLRTRAYRPSRRAVVEVTVHTEAVTGRVLYLKVLTGDRASATAAIHEHLRAHLPVPRVVGVSAAQGIIALEALEGPTLRSLLVEGGTLPDPAQYLSLADGFAAAGPIGDRDPSAFADARRHVEPLSGLVPDRAADIAMVAARAAEVAGPRQGVHGDLHDGQLLVEDGRVTGLLDLDGAGLGLLAHDAGNLIAHVQVVGELWPAVADRCEDYAAALWAIYRSRLDEADLAGAVAGAWLGLATGPYRAQEPDWLSGTRRRIDRAVAALQAGDPR